MRPFDCSFADIDECLDKNGNCSQICINEYKSFHCECRNGYLLDIDGEYCHGITYMIIQ